jgi:hypothetical protein
MTLLTAGPLGSPIATMHSRVPRAVVINTAMRSSLGGKSTSVLYGSVKGIRKVAPSRAAQAIVCTAAGIEVSGYETISNDYYWT